MESIGSLSNDVHIVEQSLLGWPHSHLSSPVVSFVSHALPHTSRRPPLRAATSPPSPSRHRIAGIDAGEIALRAYAQAIQREIFHRPNSRFVPALRNSSFSSVRCGGLKSPRADKSAFVGKAKNALQTGRIVHGFWDNSRWAGHGHHGPADAKGFPAIPGQGALGAG
jgi:hypothetical protein